MNIKELLSPIRIGPYELSNRIIMAPMTRSRADDEGVPTELVPIYYAQRAGAGLIITEGAFPAPLGKGYIRTPGIYSDAQVQGWKQVTDAVHEQKGKIFLQIMHAGRISDPSFLPGQALPVAPSAVRPNGQSYTNEGMKPHVTPRALETHEVGLVIEEYQRATQRALEAGFDGVELHAASGYLPEQFLSSKTNQRHDQYGGSLENRARFIFEVLQAMTQVAGSERVGIKIAPEMNFNDIADEAPLETYSYLVRQLNEFRLAYLHVARFGVSPNYHILLRPLFEGTYLVGGGFTRESGETWLMQAGADAIVYGRLFIANPDLPKRFYFDTPLNQADQATFYTPGPQGYIDYPVS